MHQPLAFHGEFQVAAKRATSLAMCLAAFSKSPSLMNSLGEWARFREPQPTPGFTTGTPLLVNSYIGVVPPVRGTMSAGLP